MKKLLLLLVLSLLVACGETPEEKDPKATKSNNIETVEEEKTSKPVDISKLTFENETSNVVGDNIEWEIKVTNTSENEIYKGDIYITFLNANNKNEGSDMWWTLETGIPPQGTDYIFLQTNKKTVNFEFDGKGEWILAEEKEMAIEIPFEEIYKEENPSSVTLCIKMLNYNEEDAKTLYSQLIEQYSTKGLKSLTVMIFDESFNEEYGKLPKNSFSKAEGLYSYETKEGDLSF